MVGQYTVMLEEFEPVALRALSSKSNTLIIDEIGKMENFRNSISHPFMKFISFTNLFLFRRSYFLCTVYEGYYFDKGENVSFCSMKFKAEVRRIFEEGRTGHILATIPQARGRPLPLGTEA
jgi:nucleoside-triphosphatase THEP1